MHQRQRPLDSPERRQREEDPSGRPRDPRARRQQMRAPEAHQHGEKRHGGLHVAIGLVCEERVPEHDEGAQEERYSRARPAERNEGEHDPHRVGPLENRRPVPEPGLVVAGKVRPVGPRHDPEELGEAREGPAHVSQSVTPAKRSAPEGPGGGGSLWRTHVDASTTPGRETGAPACPR